jgi:hypothetical protein
MDGFTGLCPPRETGRTGAGLQVLLVLCIVILSSAGAGCTGIDPVQQPGTTGPPATGENPAGLELVFFHPVPGCDSCDRVGLLANETVTTYFGPEVASGKIAFRDVNLNLPENRGIAERYGAYTESLWIGEYDKNGFHTTEIVDIWYYAYNRDEYLKYLRGILDRKLRGTD